MSASGTVRPTAIQTRTCLPALASESWDIHPVSIDGPGGWDTVRLSLRAEKCPWHLTLVNSVSGTVFDYTVPCDSWTHRPCAERKASRHLRHIRTLFSSQAEIWVAGADYDDRFSNRLRQRRFDRSANYLWVRRPHTAFVFSDADLGGRKEPVTGEWRDPARAYGVVRSVMWLPGIGDDQSRKAVNYSLRWQPDGDRASGINKQIAIGLSPKDEQIAKLAYARLGAGAPLPDFDRGWLRPPGVTQDAWLAALAWAWETLSGRSTRD
jgi:hypothetical protein